MTSIRAFLECHDALALWLSDSSRLSDILLCERVPVVRFFSVIGQSTLRRVPVVRFFSVIGQSTLRSRSACPILLGYRTTCFAIALCLSNSSRLSDNLSQELEGASRTVIFLLIGYYSYIVRILLSTRRKCGSIEASSALEKGRK